MQRQKKNIVNESNIFGLIDNSDLEKMIPTLAIKAELKAEQDKLVKRKRLIQVTFTEKVILKMLELKII